MIFIFNVKIYEEEFADMNRIMIFSQHGVNNAYSCLLYLKNELQKFYIVDLWTVTDEMDISEQDREGCHCLNKGWYAKIRLLGGLIMRIRVLREARKANLIIINDWNFYRCGYIIKKFFHNIKFVHYNTEIHGKDISGRKNVIKFYEKHISVPDMIIECLKERAAYRKKTFDIDKTIYTINNTLPLLKINSALASKESIEQYFKFEDKLPVIVYSGGCNSSRSLDDILECAGNFIGKINFLFFCYGTAENFNRIKVVCEKYRNCCIHQAVDRVTLLKILARCDIGIQYYDPSYSINHYLAAPSKFFEYIGVGLNVVSSNNHGIDRMIEKYDLGVCFTNKEGIKVGIEKLLTKGLNSRENIKRVFEEHFCYEVDSKETIDAIRKLIDEE